MTSFHTIFYMWGFKPNETKSFPKEAIKNNSVFLPNKRIVYPSHVEPFLQTFPELSDLYHAIPSSYWVIKADIGRLLTLYHHPGIYSDADCFIKKPFYRNNAILSYDICLFTENICRSVNELGPRECKDPQRVLRIANYFFAVRKEKDPFLKECIEECIRRLKQLFLLEKKSVLSQEDILWVCGPDVITTIFHRSKGSYKIALFDKSYLEHRCAGSWRS